VGAAAAAVVLGITAFIPAVHSLEGVAVRELLDRPVSPAPDRARGRAALMFVIHVIVGGVLGAASLIVPAAAAAAVIAPFTGQFGFGTNGATPVPVGWAGAWLPLAALAALVLLVHLVAGAGALLARIATGLLGPSAAARLHQAQDEARRLAQRNRLARELHDSVGHALSVVSVQAGAGRRSLHRDPDAAEQALLAIEHSARAALDELDHVLGLLRDENGERTSEAGLAQLPELVEATRAAGLPVDVTVEGDLDGVAAVVSRETFRIVQESLTNVLQHAGTVPVTITLRAADDRLDVTVRNPLGAGTGRSRSRGGRGLHGIAERATLLRGEFHAGPRGREWEVVARLPNGAGASPS
jgi:signal transduction histidine kinase